jgi:hypothetical protein
VAIPTARVLGVRSTRRPHEEWRVDSSTAVDRGRTTLCWQEFRPIRDQQRVVHSDPATIHRTWPSYTHPLCITSVVCRPDTVHPAAVWACWGDFLRAVTTGPTRTANCASRVLVGGVLILVGDGAQIASGGRYDNCHIADVDTVDEADPDRSASVALCGT